MLILFFAIIFIAELIITAELLRFILKADKKVIELNNKVIEFTPAIDQSFNNIRIALNKVLLGLNKFELKIVTKKQQYKIIIAKNILSWILLLFLNISNKKLSSAVDLIFAIKDLAQVRK